MEISELKTIEEITEAGSYVFTHKLYKAETRHTFQNWVNKKYLVTITGEAPFLEVSQVYDLLKKRPSSKDCLHGFCFDVQKLNIN